MVNTQQQADDVGVNLPDGNTGQVPNEAAAAANAADTLPDQGVLRLGKAFLKAPAYKDELEFALNEMFDAGGELENSDAAALTQADRDAMAERVIKALEALPRGADENSQGAIPEAAKSLVRETFQDENLKRTGQVADKFSSFYVHQTLAGHLSQGNVAFNLGPGAMQAIMAMLSRINPEMGGLFQKYLAPMFGADGSPAYELTPEQEALAAGADAFDALLGDTGALMRLHGVEPVAEDHTVQIKPMQNVLDGRSRDGGYSAERLISGVYHSDPMADEGTEGFRFSKDHAPIESTARALIFEKMVEAKGYDLKAFGDSDWKALGDQTLVLMKGALIEDKFVQTLAGVDDNGEQIPGAGVLEFTGDPVHARAEMAVYMLEHTQGKGLNEAGVAGLVDKYVRENPNDVSYVEGKGVKDVELVADSYVAVSGGSEYSAKMDEFIENTLGHTRVMAGPEAGYRQDVGVMGVIPDETVASADVLNGRMLPPSDMGHGLRAGNAQTVTSENIGNFAFNDPRIHRFGDNGELEVVARADDGGNVVFTPEQMLLAMGGSFSFQKVSELIPDGVGKDGVEKNVEAIRAFRANGANGQQFVLGPDAVDIYAMDPATKLEMAAKIDFKAQLMPDVASNAQTITALEGGTLTAELDADASRAQADRLQQEMQRTLEQTGLNQPSGPSPNGGGTRFG